MWHYRLAVTAAIFHSRLDEWWQLTLSPHGVAGGYCVPLVSHRATLRSRRRQRIVRTSSRAGESR